jgi:hypothetical protein
MRHGLLVLALLATGSVVCAEEMAGVPGSSTRFPTAMIASVAGRPVTLLLTGTAMRQKWYFNVYSVASYIAEVGQVDTPEKLAEADCPKQLHIVMERTVPGTEMADAFRAAIRMNYPEPEFTEEVNRLAQVLRNDTARKGDHLVMTHVPGVGFHCSLAGRVEFMIKNPKFSRAIWDIYLGKENLGEAIKKGLVSRL